MTLKEFAAIAPDFGKFAARFLFIKNKQAKIVPLVFNTVQQRLLQVYQEAKRLGKPLRFIILKARQEGVSTFYEALIFHRTITAFNRKAIIVGHETDSANNLFDMTKRYYDNLTPSVQPVLEHSNEKKVSFLALKSEIRIASADVGGTLKRSDTIQDLHITELAFWRAPKLSLLALLQTVPDEGETLVVIESTGNGIGGEFYDCWQDAKAGKSGYIPLFFAWFDLPEYSKSFASATEKKAFEKSLDEEEKSLKAEYKLSLEQLNWRRFTIENKCSGDVRLFHQEYPSNDTEAFITTGRPVFDPETCLKNYNAATGPIDQGDLVYEDGKKSVRFVPNTEGFISIYQKIKLVPGERFRFAAGADVAEGLEQGDYNDMPVLDRKTMRVCMSWHGHIHPDKFAEEQHKIHLFLGGDLYICTERNNHGLTTVVEANRLGLNQYYEENFKSGYLLPTDKLGFKTTPASKPQLLNSFIPAIREGHFKDDEKEFWGEAQTFVRNATGQMQAQGKDRDPSTKCFDDRIMAGALMWRCHQWLPEMQRPKAAREKEWFELIAESNRGNEEEEYSVYDPHRVSGE